MALLLVGLMVQLAADDCTTEVIRQMSIEDSSVKIGALGKLSGYHEYGST